MSRNSSPCTPRAQIALHGTLSVPTHNGSSRSINSLNGAMIFMSNSAREMSGSSDLVSASASASGAASRRAGARRMSMQDAIDVSKIDMKLYSERRRKNTLTLGEAIYEETRERERVNEQPHLDFSLRYDKESRTLTVHLIGASDLQALLPVSRALSVDSEGEVEPLGRMDLCCRVQLLPDSRNDQQHDQQQQQQQASVFLGKMHKSSTKPHFDERFVFEVDGCDIGLKVLLISVLYDEQDALLATQTCVGHVLFSLCNLQFNQSLAFRRPIVEGPPKPADSIAPCCILFSLAYLVGAERITATITKVTNLRCSKGKVQCKIIVMSPGSVKKKKTSAMRVVNETADLHEALTFTVNRKVIQQTKVRIELFQKLTFQKARMLGWLELGPDSTGYAYAHWNDMVNCKDSLSRWHQLNTHVNDDNRNSSPPSRAAAESNSISFSTKS